MKTQQATSLLHSNAAQAESTPKNKKELDRDAFMTLLTTQLQNQDPLSPLDNTQFVAQLSQFSSLERLESISSSMQALAMTNSANTSAQMVSFIGKTVDVESSAFQTEVSPPPTALGFSLNDSASTVEVTIKDSEGRVVRSLELGPHQAGEHAFQWDGLDANGAPVSPGSFEFEIRATTEEGGAVPAQPKSRRRVIGVGFEGGYPKLILEDQTEVGLGQVTQVADET